jgi:F-type H+-transporting ATPase subunit a
MNFDWTSIQRPMAGLEPEVVFSVFGFSVSNSTLAIMLIGLIFLIAGIGMKKKWSLIPGYFQAIFEITYESMDDLLQQITGNKDRVDAIFPVVGGMFIFLFFANLITFIPGLADITYQGIALFKTPTADFNTTFGLALGALIVIHIISIKEWGILEYLGKFFKFREVYKGFRKSMGDGFTALVEFFVGLLDIIGEVAKVVSLSLRLFGNMYAGQVLAIVMMSAIAFVVPTLLVAMGLFVGAIQALVFGALVAVYYTLAIKED